jgi:hypothetical protein
LIVSFSEFKAKVFISHLKMFSYIHLQCIRLSWRSSDFTNNFLDNVT